MGNKPKCLKAAINLNKYVVQGFILFYTYGFIYYQGFTYCQV